MDFLFRAFFISLLFVDADAGFECEDEDALLLLEEAIIRTAVVIVSGRNARAQRTKGSKRCEKGMGVSCAVVTKITV